MRRPSTGTERLSHASARNSRATAELDAVVDRLATAGLPTAPWQERAGDARLLGGDQSGAIAAYERSLRKNPDRAGPYTKLSDIYFLQHDVQREREYREQVYGTLHR